MPDGGRSEAEPPERSAAAERASGAIMNFELTQDQRILIESVRDFCQREIAPHSRRWDEEERFPEEIVPKLAELNLLGLFAEEEYGGAGMGCSRARW